MHDADSFSISWYAKPHGGSKPGYRAIEQTISTSRTDNTLHAKVLFGRPARHHVHGVVLVATPVQGVERRQVRGRRRDRRLGVGRRGDERARVGSRERAG